MTSTHEGTSNLTGKLNMSYHDDITSSDDRHHDRFHSAIAHDSLTQPDRKSGCIGARGAPRIQLAGARWNI